MKTKIIYPLICLAFLMFTSISAQSQQQAEVPGDNFSLEGALELFKRSSSPEEFERMLNSPEERVNNLDLNGDGYIDYVKVIDIQDGNVHAFVMQAVISQNQFQDIAVITLEKQANGKAILQITGDEDIYGVETIIEPTREVRTYAGTQSSRMYVNVWSWPIVSYVYGPRYTVWVSPWSWGFRPVWWSPWRPIVYYDYYSFWSPYYRYYSPCYTTRIVHAYNIYRPYRTTSVIVHERHNDRVVRYRSRYIDRDGRYRASNDRRSNSRVESVRYDQNGRIRSDSRNSRSSATDYSRSRSYTESRERASTNSRTRSSDSEYSRNTQRYSGDRNSNSTNNRNSQNPNTSRSSENRNTYRSSDNRNVERNSNSSNERVRQNSNVQRSTDSRSNYRSTDNSNVQRSERNYTPRSSDNSRVQKSTQRPSGSSSYQRSSGSSNSRSASPSSSYQRSSGRSSNNATIQSSPSGSRSSGNTSSGRSSGRSGSSSSSGSSRSRSR